ncbi:MAG: restriction endonuclease subunit S [Planctomycetota bacterium]
MTTQRFPKYAEYKDTGWPWLAEVPVHWSIMRLGQLGTLSKGRGGTKADEAFEGIPCVRYGDLYTTHDGFIEKPRSYIPTGRASDYTPIHPGDVLFAASGETLEEIGMSAVNLLQSGARCGGDIIILRPRAALDSRFLGYATNSSVARAQKATTGRGMTVYHIYGGALKGLALPIPPLADQQAIAAFLDRETAEIDALIAKKERLIELLDEQRTSLITQAVTKGLDPHVPMRDSGVEWLGEIPAHWDSDRIKWVARMESGHTPDKKVAAYWRDGDIPWVSLADTGQLREVDYIETTAAMTTSAGLANSSAHILPAGTVVFSRDASIGLCAITRAGMAVSQHFIGWVCGSRMLPEYLLFVLRSMTQELERVTMGATVRTIGMPDVKRLATPIPTLSEQAAIVDHILNHRTRLGRIIGKMREATDRVREYRTALISAAVTGQIDIRGEVG